jgi:hypothetical protein
LPPALPMALAPMRTSRTHSLRCFGFTIGWTS